MKIHYYEHELLIEPETDFEMQVLSHYRNCSAYLKCAITPSEICGIIIRKEKPGPVGGGPGKQHANIADSTGLKILKGER